MHIQVDWQIYNTHSQRELLSQLGAKLKKSHVIADEGKFVSDVCERERLASTVITNNLAIPHVCSSNVLKPLITVVQLAQPLPDWNGTSGIDRLILTLLPAQLSTEERLKCQQFFSNLGKQSVLNLFSSGSQRDIENYLREKR